MVVDRASAFLGIVSPKGDLYLNPFLLLTTFCIPKTASRQKSAKGNINVTQNPDLSPENALGCEASTAKNRSRPVDRWISRDPIGEGDGPNIYAYVQGDPINNWDPEGTAAYFGKKCIEAMVKAAAKKAAKNAGKGKPPSVSPKPPTPSPSVPAPSKPSTPSTPKRSKNRLPDEGPPNTKASNKPNTTVKEYGPDGKTSREANKGHGPKAPKSEQGDHIHDYTPNPKHPDGKPTRGPGRTPNPGEWQEFFP